jgi:hypothetical protein
MVLGPFAETKGPRLPGRNPAPQKIILIRELGTWPSILSFLIPSTREPDICIVTRKSLSIFPEVAIEGAVAQDLRDGFKCHIDKLLPDQTGGLLRNPIIHSEAAGYFSG